MKKPIRHERSLYPHLLLTAGACTLHLTLLVGWQEGHPACKKTEWWGAGMVICLQRGADLHTAQLMPLPLTVSSFSKIQTGFTFLVPANPGSPVCVCVRACVCVCMLGLATMGFGCLIQTKID